VGGLAISIVGPAAAIAAAGLISVAAGVSGLFVRAVRDA